jgi:hypothetical protein
MKSIRVSLSTQIYQLIVRQIPFESMPKGSYKAELVWYVGVAETKRPDNADEILKFCQTPRKTKEVGVLLGFSSPDWVKRIYIPTRL